MVQNWLLKKDNTVLTARKVIFPDLAWSYKTVSEVSNSGIVFEQHLNWNGV